MRTEKKPKITVIGAGNVGATSAMRVLESGLGDVVLLDIDGDIAKGKSEDLMDAASLIGHGCTIKGTSNYEDTKKSDVVVITAGLARKPGMTREELFDKNASIIRQVAAHLGRYNDSPIAIVVTNPLDAMTYLFSQESGLPSEKVIGMAGCLDSSRMDLAISRQLGTPIEEINSLVLGTHGETMVPAVSATKVRGDSLDHIAGRDIMDKIIRDTKARGAEIVSYLGTGSAFYAPSAGVFRMIRSVLEDRKEVLPCSVILKGEYAIKDICLGVPVRLGRNGVEEILEISLSAEENALLNAAAASVREQIKRLKQYS